MRVLGHPQLPLLLGSLQRGVAARTPGQRHERGRQALGPRGGGGRAAKGGDEPERPHAQREDVGPGQALRHRGPEVAHVAGEAQHLDADGAPKGLVEADVDDGVEDRERARRDQQAPDDGPQCWTPARQRGSAHEGIADRPHAVLPGQGQQVPQPEHRLGPPEKHRLAYDQDAGERRRRSEQGRALRGRDGHACSIPASGPRRRPEASSRRKLRDGNRRRRTCENRATKGHGRLWFAGLACATSVVCPASAAETTEATGCPVSVSADAQQEAWISFAAGRDLLYAERFAEAEAPLLAAARLDPSFPLAHYALGQAYMALKRYREAVERFAACREAFACFATGDAEKRLDREIRSLREAIRGFERDGLVKDWIPHQEMNKEPLATKGERVRFRAQLEARLEELQSWRKRMRKGGGTPPEVLVALGTAHFQAGSLATAEQAYKAALLLDPDLGDAHYDLAVVYLATERIEEAERAVRLAEKAGLTVAPRLKEELRRRKPGAQ